MYEKKAELPPPRDAMELAVTTAEAQRLFPELEAWQWTLLLTTHFQRRMLMALFSIPRRPLPPGSAARVERATSESEQTFMALVSAVKCCVPDSIHSEDRRKYVPERFLKIPVAAYL